MNFLSFDNINISSNNKFSFHYIVFLFENKNNEKYILLNNSFFNKNFYIVIGDFKQSNIFSYEKIIEKKLFKKKLKSVLIPIKNYEKKIFIYLFNLNSNDLFYKNNNENYILNGQKNLYLRESNNSMIVKKNIFSEIKIDIVLDNDLYNKNQNECENNNILIEDSNNLYIYTLDKYFIEYFINNNNKLNYYKNIINFNDLYNLHFNIINNCNLILITNNDWSNTAYRFTKSLKEVNCRMSMIKLNKHIFNYKYQGITLNLKNNIISSYPNIYNIEDSENFFINLVDNFKNIWFHASQIPYINQKKMIDYLLNKKYFVSHGGSSYRNNMSIVSKYFNKICESTLIQCPDLLKGKSNSESLIYYPVDINFIKPDYNFKNANKLVIAHYPSNEDTKGSNIIIPILKKYEDKFILNCSKEKEIGKNKSRTDWEKNLLRYKECDVYVETIKPILHNKDYGEWGNTCLEAAASGCIVLTNCTHLDLYIKNYKNIPPILICNNALELEKNIELLIKMSREEILGLKKKFRKWCEEYHNFKITGEKIRNLFLKI